MPGANVSPYNVDVVIDPSRRPPLPRPLASFDVDEDAAPPPWRESANSTSNRGRKLNGTCSGFISSTELLASPPLAPADRRMVVVAVALLSSLLSEEGGRKREKKPKPRASDDRITYDPKLFDYLSGRALTCIYIGSVRGLTDNNNNNTNVDG